MNDLFVASMLSAKGLGHDFVLKELISHLEDKVDSGILAELNKQITVLVEENEDLCDMSNGVQELTASIEDKVDQVHEGKTDIKNEYEEIKGDFERLKELVSGPAEKS